MTESSPQELHLLYVLLDSNLPTGGFVSSSGLESYAKHGFLSPIPPSYTSLSSSSTLEGTRVEKRSVSEGIVEFARAEVRNYSATSCGFVVDAWRIVERALTRLATGSEVDGEDEIEDIVHDIIRLDKYNEATLLSHVARRSSKAQGVAMLTLYSRGLSHPAGISSPRNTPDQSEDEEGTEGTQRREEVAKKIIDAYKKKIRGNRSPGHLGVCWGVMTACLGLSLDRSIHLHLFLHARSLLSSAVRLNLIGPYASSQLLLHPFKGIIEDQVDHLRREGYLDLDRDHTTSDRHSEEARKPRGKKEEEEEDFWSWADDTHHHQGPMTTWPLGEILTSRHDLQHSRIFNS
ncbi:hypothetical protein I302_107805 [Kwoniella bestiolae CBS 10118]|uniref:Uncharacterized protein n=1 Tax=Kwoniella bestiolae CBS 10118 TaxID=1296100 RepID=A0A1B9FXH3_9TREE|nr:hypothetical protein I302_06455 [Kwoniella bestiolae CBS 10118]OCF23473.1 hypothetical protein I302_06455 [Kwoniella bestiolae CBS 10118]